MALGRPYRFELVSRAARRSTAADREQLDTEVCGPRSSRWSSAICRPKVFCLEERLINVEAVPEAAGENFQDVAPGRWLLDSVPWTAAEHQISASNAARIVAASLSVPTGTACLIVERRTGVLRSP